MDIALQSNRRKILDEIKSNENKWRRAESYRQCEIFSDRLHQHVSERLREYNSEQTVREIPVIASINLARRIVKEEASIYSESPTRRYSNLSDDQSETVERIYSDMSTNPKLRRSNELYKLQNQGMLQVIPKQGKLVMRVLKMHHFDVIPDPLDPERAKAVIISNFDREFITQNYRDRTGTGFMGKIDTYRNGDSNKVNEKIADQDDSKLDDARVVWWDDQWHFMTNGHGEILDPDTQMPTEVTNENVDKFRNPIGRLPFIDIGINKDFEYFVREGTMVTEFTIDYNAVLSELEQVLRLQGFSVGVLKAPADLMPENLVVGPNNILRLPVDVETQGETDFSYANPSADIPGSIQFAEFILASFLSSRGLDPSTVSGRPEATKSSSGIERLLGMIEKFEATREDYSLFEKAERDLYDLVKRWHNALIDTDLLEDKYKTSVLPEDSELAIEFGSPEMIQTAREKFDLIRDKEEAGYISPVDALMELESMDREHALERLKQIKDDEQLVEIVAPTAPEVVQPEADQDLDASEDDDDS